MKTEFCSDNSVSLPGIIPGSTGPVGFEPGMFKNEDENSSHSHTKSKSDKDKSIDGQSKVSAIGCIASFGCWKCIESFQKKKKKDKKRHKHKKHRHHKDKKEREKSDEREKSGDRDREKSKEKKDPNISRLQMQDETPETLSSADQSSSNSNQTFQDMTTTI